MKLAQSPILDLQRIAYVSESSGEIGFNPGQNIGGVVRTKLDGLGLAVPYVMVVDGARLSLGAFVSQLSSAHYPGPNVVIEGIESDSMVIQFGGAGSDPLKDERTLTALRVTGILI